MRGFFLNKYSLLLLILLVGGAGLFAFVNKGRLMDGLRYLDRHYMGEGLRDARARLTTAERWAGLPVAQYDYAWLDKVRDRDGVVRIAHALGAKPEANSLAALETSRAAGFHVFEVDLWLDGQGILRCHHGPKPPPVLGPEGCTFSRLLKRIQDNEYLVLDIKTGFAKTTEAVLAVIDQTQHRGKHVIFQLYTPDHVEMFRKWTQTYDLAGPIVTVYRSERGLKHIYRGVQAAGIRALTYPIERMPVLAGVAKKESAVGFLTHPVSSCQDLFYVLKNGADGVYIKNDLACMP